MYPWSRTLPYDRRVPGVTGVGIGSALVPLVAVRVGLKVAIAIVAAPHLIGGLARAMQLRRSS